MKNWVTKPIKDVVIDLHQGLNTAGYKIKFYNTGYPINVAEVYVEWNHDNGHQGDDTSLRLSSISLNSQTWQGNILSPSQYIRDYRPVIPVGSSVVKFTFHQNYNIPDGTERVIIYLLTPGCEGYLIDSNNK